MLQEKLRVKINLNKPLDDEIKKLCIFINYFKINISCNHFTYYKKFVKKNNKKFIEINIFIQTNLIHFTYDQALILNYL